MKSVWHPMRMVFSIVSLWSVLAVAATQPLERPWTVQDSVAVRYFATSWSGLGVISPPDRKDEPATFSPDGKHFFFVSLHGDSRSDQAVYELWVYSTEAVQRALAADGDPGPAGLPPLRKLVMRSAFRDLIASAAIYLPQWESNHTLTFEGVEGNYIRRPYRYDVSTGALTPLIEPQYFLPENSGGNYTIRGSTILFLTEYKSAWEQQHDPFWTVDRELFKRLYGPSVDRFRAHASYKGAPAKVVADFPIGMGVRGPWISPDEKWAVLTHPLHDGKLPTAWSGYRFRVWPMQRMLIDLQTGTSQPIVRGPVGPALFFDKIEIGPMHWPAFWSADSRRVLLFNTALPLDARYPQRRTASYAIDYDVQTGAWSVVDVVSAAGESCVSEAAWLEEGRSAIVVRYDKARGKRLSGKIYRFDSRRWTVRDAGNRAMPMQSPTPSGLTVRLQQSANEPPRMVAAEGTHELTLTDADPALEGLWRAPVETIHWKDDDGKEVESLLMLPRDFSPQKRAPLVIQLSDPWNPADAFWPDGLPGTGFAAQALAAQGFVVLQMEPAGYSRKSPLQEDPEVVMTPREGPAQVRRVDAAVELLKRRGLVDEAPIGLIGFSRSGYYTYYVATHPGKTPLGAAVVFDSVTCGYGEYVMLTALDGAGSVQHYGFQYGKEPSFWRNKQGWLDAPAFNLERLKTPMLFEFTTGATFLTSETIGAFKHMRRPFEYLQYPGAPHLLQSPRQREAAMQATLDWMGFWLQNRERATPDAPGRFERWQKIKADWQRTLAEEAAAHKEHGLADVSDRERDEAPH